MYWTFDFTPFLYVSNDIPPTLPPLGYSSHMRDLAPLLCVGSLSLHVRVLAPHVLDQSL